MDPEKQKHPEAAGYQIFDDAADWLGLTEDERKQVDEMYAKGLEMARKPKSREEAIESLRDIGIIGEDGELAERYREKPGLLTESFGEPGDWE